MRSVRRWIALRIVQGCYPESWPEALFKALRSRLEKDFADQILPVIRSVVPPKCELTVNHFADRRALRDSSNTPGEVPPEAMNEATACGIVRLSWLTRIRDCDPARRNTASSISSRRAASAVWNQCGANVAASRRR